MIGATLGRRYELRRLLGKGGMGSVYEAEDREDRGRVAVKVLHSHLLEPDGEAPRRFRREAEAARAIPSDYVVRVLAAGTCEETGHLYLVTEYLEGEDLQRLLDRTGSLSPAGAMAIACQALVGLGAAHAARVVHRDVKPANLFLARGPDGAITVKILDFGIAKIRPDALGSPMAAGTTTAGGLLGSPLYMSPEQVQSGRDVDHRTDLWSLGCVLYAALAGQAPHQHLGSIGRILHAISAHPPPPLGEVAPWVPSAIAAVVHVALERRPAARYPDAAAMLAAIRPLAPPGALTEDLLSPSGEQPRPPMAQVSTLPPSPPGPSPRVIVVRPDAYEPAREDAIHGRELRAMDTGTLSSASEGWRTEVARSAVPVVGTRVGARVVIVDPRRFLGTQSELWELSLDVHRNVSSLVARIWRSLRRAGARLPPMSYGTAWALVEARTGRAIVEPTGDAARLTLEEAGIRAGTVLWVVRPEDPPPAAS